MRNTGILAVLAVALAVSGCSRELTDKTSQPRRLAHNVYFTLHDDSAAARTKLVADCYVYLSHEHGIAFFSAGEIVASHQRDVNVRDWSVGLHVVFETRADHDRYQEASRHQRFIEENKANWKTVRVFDTYVK